MVMPMQQSDVYRVLRYDAGTGGYTVFHRLAYRINFADNQVYDVYSPEHERSGGNVTLDYSFKRDADILVPMALIFLLLQFFILNGSLNANKRSVEKALRPIHDIVSTVSDITPDVPNVGQLAGQISSIQANELTRRLSVGDKPDELKPLTVEINALLARINDAYDAQVRFVSDAAHELRTPISVVQGYVNLLDRWGKTDEKTLQESIDAIKHEAHSMTYLIEQLHFLAQGENDTLRLNVTEFDICELVLETIEDMRLIDAEHTYEAAAVGKIIIKADRELLKQSLRILLENSRKYSPSGTVIAASVKSGEKDVTLTVEDNGIGIAAEALPHIFEGPVAYCRRHWLRPCHRKRNHGGAWGPYFGLERPGQGNHDDSAV
jgi:signal transduction histidine kinase